MWSTTAVWKQYNKMAVLHFFLLNSPLIYILFSLFMTLFNSCSILEIYSIMTLFNSCSILEIYSFVNLFNSCSILELYSLVNLFNSCSILEIYSFMNLFNSCSILEIYTFMNLIFQVWIQFNHKIPILLVLTVSFFQI